MAAPGPELVLGMDTQPTRLGLGLVCRHTAVPLWAGTFSLRLASMDGAAAAIAIRAAREWALQRDLSIVELAIERGIVRGTSLDTLYDCGAAYGVCRYVARRTLRDELVRVTDDVRPSAVKSALLGQGRGNAPKSELTLWVRRHALAHGWDEVQMNGLARDDATDALAIGTFIARERIATEVA